jgi:branched-chain amino acid transport system substrate-binding protein
MKGTRRALVALVALALAVGWSACGSDDSDSEGGGGGEGAIKIGAVMPLTGPLAPTGLPVKKATEVAFEELNANGGINGRKVEFLARDNAFNPQQTIQVARELVADDVQAFVSSVGTAPIEAGFPYMLDQAKVPVLMSYGGAASWYDPPRPLLYGYQTLYEDQARTVGAWAAEDGHSKLMVLRLDLPALEPVTAEVEPGAKSIDPGASVVGEVPVKVGTTDFAPIVSKVKAANPDAVILLLGVADAAGYIKQANVQGLEFPTYSYVGAADEGLIKLAGADAAEGLKAVALSKLPHDPGPELDEFRAAMAKYGNESNPTMFEVTQYGAVKAFIEIVSKIEGDITPQSIADAFAGAGTVETGILPPLTFSEDKHIGTNEVQRIVVREGRFESIGDFVAPPPR